MARRPSPAARARPAAGSKSCVGMIAADERPCMRLGIPALLSLHIYDQPLQPGFSDARFHLSLVHVVIEALYPQTFNASFDINRESVSEVEARGCTDLPQEAAQCSLVKGKRVHQLVSSYAVEVSPKSCSTTMLATRIRTCSDRLALHKLV